MFVHNQACFPPPFHCSPDFNVWKNMKDICASVVNSTAGICSSDLGGPLFQASARRHSSDVLVGCCHACCCPTCCPQRPCLPAALPAAQ